MRRYISNKAIVCLVTALAVGWAGIAQVSAQSSAANFIGQSVRGWAGISQETYVSQFHLPDGTNNTGLEDQILRAGSGLSFTGDTLTLINTVGNIGYVAPGPYNGSQAIIIDNNLDGVYTPQADIFFDDGSFNGQVGMTETVEGTTLKQIPLSANLKFDSLSGALWVDQNNNNLYENSDELSLLKGNPTVGATTGVSVAGSSYVYAEKNSNGQWDESEDIFIATKSLDQNGQTRYATRADNNIFGDAVISGSALNSDLSLTSDNIKYTGNDLSGASDMYRDTIESATNQVNRVLDIIRAITFKNRGSANQNDISELAVYSTPDKSGYLGSATWDGDGWSLVNPANADIKNGGRDVFVFAKTTNSPVDGRTIQLEIPALNDFSTIGQYDNGEEGFFVQSTNDGPEGGAVFESNVANFVTIDAIAPVLAVTSPANNGFVNDSEPTLNYSTSGASFVDVTVDGKMVGTILSGQRLNPLKDGTHTVKVEARDEASNRTSVEINFTVDTVAPAPGLTFSPNGIEVGPNDTLVFAGVTKPDSTVKIEVFSPVKVIETKSGIDGKWRVEIAAAEVGSGNHNAYATITDKAGNIARYQIASFKILSKLDSVLSPVVSAIQGQESLIPDAPKAEAAQPPAQTGEIKASETELTGRNWATVITAIAIIIVAAGLGTAGFYGYEWWLNRAATQPVEPTESKPKSKNGKKDSDIDLRW